MSRFRLNFQAPKAWHRPMSSSVCFSGILALSVAGFVAVSLHGTVLASPEGAARTAATGAPAAPPASSTSPATALPVLGAPASAPPTAVLTGMFESKNDAGTTTAPVRLDLRGRADGQLSFDEPISCKLGLRYLGYRPETGGHQYSVIPPKDGAAGMAHFCNQRLYKSIWVQRDPGTSDGYVFKDTLTSSPLLRMQVRP